MLQHNVAGNARRAHIAHAAVVGGHVLCCGGPIALTLLAAGLGASAGLNLVSGFVGGLHAMLHASEALVLAASAALVALGAWLEWRAHRGRRVSPLFAVSLTCFVINAALIWAHQGAL